MGAGGVNLQGNLVPRRPGLACGGIDCHSGSVGEWGSTIRDGCVPSGVAWRSPKLPVVARKIRAGDQLVWVPMPVVRGVGLVKSYGVGRAAVQVLGGVDVEVAAGEVVASLAGRGRAATPPPPARSARSPGLRLDELDGVHLEDAGEAELTEVRRTRVGFASRPSTSYPSLPGSRTCCCRPGSGAMERRSTAGAGSSRASVCPRSPPTP